MIANLKAQPCCSCIFVFMLTAVSWAETTIVDVLIATGGTATPAAENPVGVFSNQPDFAGYLNEPPMVDLSEATSITVTDTAIGLGATVEIREMHFDTFTNGGPPETVAGLLTPPATNTFRFEKSVLSGGDGTLHDMAISEAWGVVSRPQGINDDTPTNEAMVFDVSGSAEPIYFFGADLLDFEGGGGMGGSAAAWVAVYGLEGSLLVSQDFDFPDLGNEVTRFFGIEADEPIGTVAFFVGSDDAGMDAGFGEHLGVADIYLGGTSTIPEPGAIGLLVSAIPFFLSLKRSTFC